MVRAEHFSAALFPAFCRDLGFGDLASKNRFDPLPNGISLGFGSGTYGALSAISSLFKKTEVEEDPNAELATLGEFLEANEACASVTAKEFRARNFSIASGLAISYARGLLWEWFEQQNEPQPAITMASIETAARFGPGRSVGLKDKPSLFYFKVGDSVQTAASDFVRSWYETSVLYNPLCEAAELARKARWGKAEVRKAGLLSFVPKKYTRRRTVVTEPSLNTYFQLGLGLRVEEVLSKRVGIHFTSQPGLNSELAWLGSVDGSYGTMDLKQCSDYISLALIEFMFPPSLARWVRTLRTPEVRMPNGEELPLHMASTMGNGFTFPLMTALLSAIVLGVYQTLDIETHETLYNGARVKRWGVFGDDIVVDRHAYCLVAEVCEDLGLHVSLDKSYNAGPFRESCGTDFYEGVNVRPLYLKRYTTRQDLFSCFNRLSAFGADRGYNLSESLLTVLEFMNPADRQMFVPPDEMDTAGIKLPLPPTGGMPLKSGALGWQYRAYHPDMSSISFELWEVYTSGEIHLDTRRQRERFRKWMRVIWSVCSGSVNEPALLKAMLQGGLRRGRLSPRLDKARYRVVDRETPRWGYHLEACDDLSHVRDLRAWHDSVMTAIALASLLDQ